MTPVEVGIDAKPVLVVLIFIGTKIRTAFNFGGKISHRTTPQGRRPDLTMPVIIGAIKFCHQRSPRRKTDISHFT